MMHFPTKFLRRLMRTRTAAATAVVLAALLSACSSTEVKSAPATPSTSATPTADQAASPSPEAPVTPMKLGADWAWEAQDGSASGKTSVLDYTQPVSSVGSAAQESGEKGYVWAALEVKVCTEKGSIIAGTSNWTLAYEDGAVVESSSTTYDDFPKPEFPAETSVKAGRCVRGKVVYPVPGGQHPARVVYAPNGAQGASAEWTIPGK
ncbi:hypothetical protein ADL21_11250 [Streptomyces albus subsp. albus]|nr:hypothetical protein ADL21_11250 [Streptomyces albus subsp. albus]